MIDEDRNQRLGQSGRRQSEEWAGKATGDKKTETEGKVDQAKGKVQSAVGGLKDALRGK